VLAAAERRAGAEYGWDAVVAWPRLYPILTDQVRAVVDARRDTLDASARLTITATLTAVASTALLCRTGWWLLIALIPLATGWLAYTGTIQSALAYGEALTVAFDLCRFDLIKALHLPPPNDLPAERDLANTLCLQWRQGVSPQHSYHHT
jgi:hypothetical protein